MTSTPRTESQNAICKRLLKSGKKISPLTMFKNYGILRLAARIKNLKDEGMKIHTEMVFLHPVKYARYSLVKK